MRFIDNTTNMVVLLVVLRGWTTATHCCLGSRPRTLNGYNVFRTHLLESFATHHSAALRLSYFVLYTGCQFLTVFVTKQQPSCIRLLLHSHPPPSPIYWMNAFLPDACARPNLGYFACLELEPPPRPGHLKSRHPGSGTICRHL